MKILVPTLIAMLVAASEATKCERIKVDVCQDIGYNHTAMPNLAHHNSQAEVELALDVFKPLFDVGCYPHMRLFVCSAYVPMCAASSYIAQRVGPCKGLCEEARANCAPIMQGLGYLWPSQLECSKFHHEDDYEHMCIMGPLK